MNVLVSYQNTNLSTIDGFYSNSDIITTKIIEANNTENTSINVVHVTKQETNKNMSIKENDRPKTITKITQEIEKNISPLIEKENKKKTKLSKALSLR